LFQCILELGFPVEKARKTILDLNDVNIMKLRNGEVSASSLYNTRNGERGNFQSMQILANSVGLKVREMFPDRIEANP